MNKSKVSSDEIAHEGASQLYLLSWYDALDRLDTLLLESRHLQMNIISTLRTPELFDALRFEEKHLWGKGWSKGLKNNISKNLVNNWMITFPHPHHLDKYEELYSGTKSKNIRKNNVLRLLHDALFSKLI